ncbi:MAG: bifunctional diaminohydroxyphosphoribosylaminopyrimidine deaminase/5-amino-6-(5-phosphoribosylamino)uracil reductase RibD [Dehalococcoidia bacterium]|nr:bifunctional diaminohydroxyphosphoribosylaminopyrimidine deaminase/5-amino-6-(5-phosphoribosylamino)uracil reductase RibD [Dehalococcoidia bacterium]
MQRALALARDALGTTSPNPTVGAVLVMDGQVVGEGVTQPPPGPHAEVVALRQAGERARGATLYVTLEPCSHHGRTPPCTQSLIEKGVAQVHMAVLDPNPLVAGKGQATLEEAGVGAFLGEGAEQAQQLYEAHARYITTGLPLVVAKFAMSLDGKIATATGHSQWITGEETRHHSNRLRGVYDAILVGIETALADDPLLTYRDSSGTPHKRQPLRVVVDSTGRMPPTAKLLAQPGKTLVATARIPPEQQALLERAGAEVVALPGEDGRVDLHALLRLLGQREVTSVIVEGGSTLLGALFDQRLVDKVMAFVAPIIVGGGQAPTPVGGVGIHHMAEALALQRVTVERIGDDLLVIGYCPKA